MWFSFKSAVILHFLISLIRIGYILLNHLDLSTEEAQYWLWSKYLDFSYYSKPPLIAYFNAISTSILGDTEIGVRINAVLISFGVGILFYLFGFFLFKDKKLAFFSSLFVLAVPAFEIASIIFLTDTPLLLFWVLTSFFFFRALDKNQKSDWLLTGIFGGLGFLSKYSMIFFFPIAIIYLFIFRREIFFNRWFYFSILIASVFTLPIIIWNFQHDFVTFKHIAHLEGADIKQISLEKSLSYIAEYIGGQILLNSIFLFPFFVYTFYKGAKNIKDAKIFYLWFPAVFVFLVFLYISFKKRVEANWPAFAYATFYLLTAFYIYKKRWFKSFFFGFLFSCFFIILFFYSPLIDKLGLTKIYPPEKDMTKRLVGWEDLGKKVSQIIEEKNLGKFFIFSDSYHIASELAFYVKGNPKTYCINLGRRMNQFDLWEGIEQFERKGYFGVFVSNNKIMKKH
ncbi:MAG: glycosyltransferase family 39 protein, partial [Aquificae bacterium]|nr:glycosyltransferase family 39 protein [Aquificota bacterium]